MPPDASQMPPDASPKKLFGVSRWGNIFRIFSCYPVGLWCESRNAAGVWEFLLEFARGSGFRLRQVDEVVSWP